MSTMPEQIAPADPADGRDESANQRSDRNWNELLAELRVTQTGVQVLTGFLLTIPFQQRFAELDSFQVGAYLAVLALAVITTGLLVAPVALHRILFHRGLKAEMVTTGDKLARAGLAVLALVVAGTVLLIVDVAASRTLAVFATTAAVAMLATLWWALPRSLIRDSPSGS